MKLLGILMIVISFSAAGFYLSENNVLMLAGIKRSEKLLDNIIPYIKNERMSIFEIFENVSLVSDEHTKRFIENLDARYLADDKNLALKLGFCTDKTSADILNEALSVLGKYSAEEQTEKITFCRNKLRNLLDKMEEPIKSKAKLLRFSGILTGVAVAIILF